MNRVIPYVLTNKQSDKRPRTIVLWPHLFSALVLGLAWAGGLLWRHGTDGYVAVWAVVMILGCLAVFASQFARFPQPFDPELLDFGASGSHGPQDPPYQGRTEPAP